MKAVILISSIFYFLGLLIGNMFHIAKESAPIETIIVNKIKTIQPKKVFYFGTEDCKKEKTSSDLKITTTTKNSESATKEDTQPESK
jgi:hypothetical protein